MGSPSYDVIRGVIIENNNAPPGGLLHAIAARLQPDPIDDPPNQTRKLFPLVLGKDATNTIEMVLMYQYAGYSKQPLDPNFSKKNFRCFKVDALKNTDPLDPAVQRITFSPSPAFTIPKLKFKDVKRQNCVDEDNVDKYYS